MPARIVWTPELEDKICDGLLEGHSLRGLCKQDSSLPDRITIIRHMHADEAFATKCARARTEQADLMDDRILDVAQKVEDGTLDPNAGRVVLSALQWRASKLAPKKYGDKVEQYISGPDGGPVQSSITVNFVKPVDALLPNGHDTPKIAGHVTPNRT